MTIRIVGSLLFCGLLTLAVLTPATATAAAVFFTCNPTKVKGSASNGEDSSSTSKTFVTINEATVNFTQGGSSASCVLVRFSAEGWATRNYALYLRAFLDNRTAALPTEVAFVATGVSSLRESRSFEFIFPSVAPGNHTVRMQLRSSATGKVTLGLHNTVVHHAP